MTTQPTSCAGSLSPAASMRVIGLTKVATRSAGFWRQVMYAAVKLQSREPSAVQFTTTIGPMPVCPTTQPGLPVTNFSELDLFTEFTNRMTFSASLWADNLTPAYCDRCARGGPALRVTPDVNLLINVGADPRPMVVPTFAAIYSVGDYGSS